MLVFWRLGNSTSHTHQLMRLQKHCTLHHFFISDSQSIKSFSPKKWISVLNFCIPKMLFPSLLIDKIDATLADSSRHLPSCNSFEAKDGSIISLYKDVLDYYLANCKMLTEIVFLITCVFISLHNAIDYVTIHVYGFFSSWFSYDILFASCQKNIAYQKQYSFIYCHYLSYW